MKHNPRVIIDVDGVLRDFVGSLIRVYKREFPEHEIAPVVSRKLENFFPIGERIYQFMDETFAREILEEALAYPGAIEALRRWENEFDMVIATTQPPAGRAPTFTWIARHDLPVDEVHITAHKYRIPGIALLDDFEDNLNHFQATGRLAVCLDQPWNLQWEGPRVGSPDEFFAYVWDYIHNRDSDFDEDMLLA